MIYLNVLGNVKYSLEYTKQRAARLWSWIGAFGIFTAENARQIQTW